MTKEPVRPRRELISTTTGGSDEINSRQLLSPAADWSLLGGANSAGEVSRLGKQPQTDSVVLREVTVSGH